MSLFRPYPQVRHLHCSTQYTLQHCVLTSIPLILNYLQVLAHIEAIATEKYRALQSLNPSTFISGNESIVDMNWQEGNAKQATDRQSPNLPESQYDSNGKLKTHTVQKFYGAKVSQL